MKNESQRDLNQLCDIIRETGFAIHCYHGPGHLEKVYENALFHRLKKQGIQVEQQQPLMVYDEDGTELGEYFADLVVEEKIIIELKACDNVAPQHIAQILGYLKSARIGQGLLINFGNQKFQIKKYLSKHNAG